jgi:hypothetical protein
VLGALLLIACVTSSSAQSADPAPAQPATPRAAPYSLPWQLRTVTPANVLRLESVLAFYEDAMSNEGRTSATILLGSWRATPKLALLGRAGLVSNSPPTGESAVSVVNPILGALYAPAVAKDFRAAFFLGTSVPVGMGGGNSPDVAVAAATRSGIFARSAMDNAMFAVNDWTIFPGAGLAYVKRGLTVQGEVTVLQLTRVRGEDLQKDSAKTNFTSGVHVGYFVRSDVSLGGEFRYQRWLSTPAAVEADPTGASRDTASIAFGVRFHVRAGERTWLRPGIAYARGLDDPMAAQGYDILHLDVPVAF